MERIEKAINWLKAHGDQKIGIVGASTTGTLALTAASYFKDITLTIGLTPSDFIHKITKSWLNARVIATRVYHAKYKVF